MGCTIKTSFCLRVPLSMRSPVAMSNGCAPVWASYPAITSFTSSMSAVAGSYSRSVLSPSDENVRILAFMVDLLRDVNFRFPEGEKSGGFGSLRVILHRFSELSRQRFRTPDSERPGPRSHIPSPTVDNITLRFSRWYARGKYFRQRITVLKGQ